MIQLKMTKNELLTTILGTELMLDITGGYSLPSSFVLLLC
uniref:Uncharacterized protein n=1 Tax=Anguilla anguilla TaxID=7936 RepID=A0A0E9SQE1_ANGAN